MRRTSRKCSWQTPPYPRRCAYMLTGHGYSGNGLNLADGRIGYKELHTVITEAVAVYAHIYVYGVSKFTFLAELGRRPIHNVEYLEFPPPATYNCSRWFILPCHKFPRYPFANKTAHSLYDLLTYSLQKKDKTLIEHDPNHSVPCWSCDGN